MLTQPTRITAVQRRRETLPLTIPVTHDSLRVVGLPDDAVGIDFRLLVALRHPRHHAFRKTVVRELGSHLPRRVYTVVMTVVRAPPDLLFLIFKDHHHAVVHTDFLTVIHRLVDLEGVAVKTVQTIPCTEPHEPLFVLQNSHDGVLAQSVLDGVVLDDIMLMRAEAQYPH